MNEDPPSDSNEDFQWKCRIGEMKPAVIVTRKKSLETPSNNFPEGRASLPKEGSVGGRF